MVNTEIRLIDYILCSQRWRSSIKSANELLIAKFRLKLKKVGKITRPFRYDLNQMTNLDSILKSRDITLPTKF